MSNRFLRAAQSAAAAVVVCVLLLPVGCGPSDESSGPKAVEEPVIVVDRLYRFLDEIQEQHPGFEPKATMGISQRTILARPLDANSQDGSTPGLSWSPIESIYRSKRVRIPDTASISFAVGYPHPIKRFTPIATEIKLSVERAEGTVDLLSAVMDPAEPRITANWIESSIDLNAFAGQAVRFVFTTKPLPGAEVVEPGTMTAAVWADPVLVNETPSSTEPAPNVVLISLDTLRADHLGCYGYDRPTSPNIDAFAEEAVLFENAFASSSWTLSSHASLFTGTAPSTHGVTFQKTDGPRPHLDRGFRTLAEIARENEYRTAAFTEGGYVHPDYGFGQGFEQYSATFSSFNKSNTLRTFRAAADWMHGMGDQPFFMFLHTYQIHTPYSPPAEYLERFPTEPGSRFPERFDIFPRPQAENLTPEDKRQIVTLYDAEIAFTDEVVRAFLNTLKVSGLWEDTLVILFSDHGEEFWEHGDMTHGLTLHTEVIHVPLIVKLPGAEPRTGRVSDLVSLTDVYATVCDAMGWDYDASLDSRSFLDVLRSDAEFEGRDYVYSELGYRPDVWTRLNPNPRSIAVRSLEESFIGVRGAEREEFYLLADDPGELRDRISEFPGRAKTMRERIRRYLSAAVAKRDSIQFFDPVMTELTDQLEEQLRALGYLE